MYGTTLRHKFQTLLDYIRCYKLVQFVFMMTFIASLTVVYIAHFLHSQNQTINAQYIVSDYAHLIENNVAQSLGATYPLASFIQNQDGNTLGFEALAEKILTFYPAASSLQLAPNGIVKHIIPLKGNEKAIGHDLLLDPKRTKEAFLAKETKQLTLAGPFKLKQGGVGVIGRLPIYLPNQEGQELFWGFSSVLLDFPKLLEIAQLSKLEERGFAYTLSRIHPDTHEKEVIAASQVALEHTPIQHTIHVPNNTWTLRAAPIQGWYDKSLMVFEVFLAVIFAFFVTLLTIFFKNLDLQNSLKEQALYDPLTHLPNRAFFKDIFLTKQHIYPLSALCFLDLDYFKQINDMHGHKVGDLLLIEVAHKIQTCLRETDTLSRRGGDEFVIMLSSLNTKDDATTIVQRILHAVETPYTILGISLSISASIGIVFYTNMIQTPLEELITHADESMYRAKMNGRNGYAIYEPAHTT